MTDDDEITTQQECVSSFGLATITHNKQYFMITIQYFEILEMLELDEKKWNDVLDFTIILS